MSISDMALRKMEGTKGEKKEIRVSAGLYLWITVNQGGKTKKTWYLRYSIQGKKFRSKLGEYPELSLAKALAAAEDAKNEAKHGVNLAKKRKAERNVEPETQAITFESIANDWLQRKLQGWEPRHAKRQKERLSANIFTAFGHRDVNEITMDDIDKALKPIIDRDARETAQRICTMIRNIFDHADTMGHLSDPVIIARLAKYRKAMPQPLMRKSLYNDMSNEEIGKLLAAVEDSKMRWTLQTSVALRLAPYLLLRPGELCGLKWKEINFEERYVYIMAPRMKGKIDHIVPLPVQAIALLKEIQPYSGYHQYVFPSSRSGNKHMPIGTASLVQALRRLGYASTKTEADSFTTHGFRGMASTILHQRLRLPGISSDVIEHQLAHVEKDKIKAAYNKINVKSYLEERREMMQKYADYLDNLRCTAKTAS